MVKTLVTYHYNLMFNFTKNLETRLGVQIYQSCKCTALFSFFAHWKFTNGIDRYKAMLLTL